MNILAFESSCDDTSVALVKNGQEVLWAQKISQHSHEKFGGVVPEIAARAHEKNIFPILENCRGVLQCAGIENQIDAIAVANRPGLQNALLVSTTVASFLALLWQKPIIPVNHIFAHFCANFLERNVQEFEFPALVLTASGGHTELHFYEKVTKPKLIGKTIDDAAGEAFDKTAKMLGLKYPGGPEISREAEKGDRHAIKFPRILLDRDSLDFSFSGLKAAVYRVVENVGADLRVCPKTKSDLCVRPKTADKVFPLKFISDVSASFEQCVADTLLKKISRALEAYPQTKSFHFVGGVSANTFLNQRITEFCKKKQIKYFRPKKIHFSTDNAEMIGAAAHILFQENPKKFSINFVDAVPSKKMENLSD